MELITIKESHYPADLLILKSKLESEGIKCFLKDELTSEILTHIPSMSAKLQVFSQDLPKVKEILIETGELEPDQITPLCPYCGSDDLKMKLDFYEKFNLVIEMFKSLNIFSKPTTIKQSSVYICKQCDKELRF